MAESSYVYYPRNRLRSFEYCIFISFPQEPFVVNFTLIFKLRGHQRRENERLDCGHTSFTQRSSNTSHTLANAHTISPKLSKHFIDRMEMSHFSISPHCARYQDTEVILLVLLFVVSMPLTNFQNDQASPPLIGIS